MKNAKKRTYRTANVTAPPSEWMPRTTEYLKFGGTVDISFVKRLGRVRDKLALNI
jgi:hypothetical protein